VVTAAYAVAVRALLALLVTLNTTAWARRNYAATGSSTR
jgi:hypothetical protein